MIYNDIKILVDVFHNEKTENFSTISDDLADRLFANPDFGNADYLIYTHDHPDHYSKELTERYAKSYPDTQIIKPWENPPKVIDTPGLGINFLPLSHEGRKHKNVIHYGILITLDEKNILFTGDVEVASCELTDALKNVHLDLAVLDFPWITLRKGRSFILESLKPDHILVNHLPTHSEDKNNYIGYTNRFAKQLDHPDLQILIEPFDRALFTLM